MKKKRAAAAVAAVTTAGVAVGGAFPSPRDLMGPDDGPVPAPITELLVPTPDAPEAGDMADDDPGTEDGDELRRRSAPAARFRAWVLRLPLAVRLGAGVPLWCLGWLALTVLSGLWSALLSPVLGTVLSWAVTALLLLGALAFTVKAALPEVPLEKLLDRRCLLALLLGTAALGVLDAALPLVFHGYERWEALFRAASTALLLGTLTAAILRRQRKAAMAAPEPEEPEEPEETPEQAQERALRFVRELADEVSPKRRV